MKALKAKFSLLFLLIVISAIYCDEAFACSCVPPRPVNERLENSRVVVIARLSEIVGEFNLSNELHFSRWKVERVYKGDLKPGDTIELWQGSGGDGVGLYRKEQINSRFLLFMQAPTTEYPNRYAQGKQTSEKPFYDASYCSGSTAVDHAARDLSYLDKIDELREKTRLTGTFHAGIHQGLNLADVKVKVIGEKKTLDLKTDRTGYFETYDLPPGEYRVALPAQPGWKLNDPRLEYSTGIHGDIGKPYKQGATIQIPIMLGERRHIALDLFFEPSGGIRGRVIGPSGEAIYDLPMRLSQTMDLSGSWIRQTTDRSGEFEFRAIKPGKYYLGIFNDGLMSQRVPFATVYYPGTFDGREARMVEIGPDVIENLLIQVTELMPTTEIKGRLVFSDGSPARGSVRFEPDGPPFSSEGAGSSEDGHFTLKIIASAKGKIVGHSNIDRGRGCPEWLKLLDAAKSDYLNLRSSEVAYSGEPLTESIELKLPVTKCDKPQ